MANVSYLGASQPAFDALSIQVAGMLPIGTYTIATLPAANAASLHRLVTVTDLFGSRSTRLRCEKVTIATVDYYYWQPSSSDSFGPLDVSGSNVVIGALSMPTTFLLTGNIGASVTRNVVVLDGAFPGQTKEVRMSGAIGTGASLLLQGTGLGSGVSVASGGYVRIVSDWYTTPGLRAWLRIA